MRQANGMGLLSATRMTTTSTPLQERLRKAAASVACARERTAWLLALKSLEAARRNVRSTPNVAGELSKLIDVVNDNDLRRTCLSWLRASGVAPHLLAPVAGHVDSRMVERVYGRLQP